MIDLIVKDLKRALRDKKALAIILIMPIILMTILGFTVGRFLMGDGEWLRHINVGIVSLDNREDLTERVLETFNRLGVSEEIINYEELKDGIRDIDLEKSLLNIFELDEIKAFLSYEVLSEKEAFEKLDKGELSSLIIIPQDFTYNTFLSLGTPFTQRQEIELIINRNRQYDGRIVQEIINGYTRVISSAIIGKNALLELGAELGVGGSLYSEINKMITGITSNTRLMGLSIENTNTMKAVNGMQYYAVAQGMMFILYVIGFFSKYSLDEKLNHTHDRLLVSGTRRAKILLSIGLSSGITVLLQILVFVIYSSLVFKITWGNIIDVFIFSIFVALAIVGLTSLMAAISLKASNLKIANMFDGIIVILFSALGGSFVPLWGAPALERLGRFTPNGAAINGFIKIMQGYGIRDVIPSIVVLISIFAFAFILGQLVLNSKEVQV